MAGFKINKQIEAPIETVFAALTDITSAPETISGITKMELLTNGPVGKGTRFRETRVMFGREATEEMEVTAFETPRRYVLGCENHGCRYRTEYLLTERGGGTELSMEFDAEPLTLFAKVMSVLMKMMSKKMIETCGKDLDDLKVAIES